MQDLGDGGHDAGAIDPDGAYGCVHGEHATGALALASTRALSGYGGRMRAAAALLLLVACSSPPERVLVTFQTGEAPYVVRAEVADEPGEWSRGLMGRESLDPGTGMLFVFNEPREVPFHMENTLIPLDLISIRDGKVVAVDGMVPCPPEVEDCPDTWTPLIDAALEVAAGTAEQAGIKPGIEVDSDALA